MFLDCNEIIKDTLWVGGYIRAGEVRYLRQLGITAVLSLQSDRDLNDYGISLKELVEAYGVAEINFCRIPIVDFDKHALAANLSRGVEELEKAMASKWAKVYVHCTAGVNRSPTLAAAYLIKARGLSAREAYDFVINRRHCSPYLDTLQAYESSIRIDPAGHR